MPSPIDHRDVTLTESGRPTNYQHLVVVHLDTVTIAGGVTAALFNSVVTDTNGDDKTRHELRLTANGNVAAAIFWDSELRFAPAGAGVQSTKTATSRLVPSSSGPVTSARPLALASAFSPDPLPGPWDFAFFVWKATPTFAVVLTETQQQSGKTWAIAVTQGTTLKYSGNLSVTFTSSVIFNFASMTEKMRRKVERLVESFAAPPAAKPSKRKKATKKTR